MTTFVTMSSKARVFPAGRFKAKCLELMDDVARDGRDIVITKRGRPVARLAPLVDRPPSLRGLLRGQIEIGGDIVGPVGADWTLR
jgi:prevent-host-death family protein